RSSEEWYYDLVIGGRNGRDRRSAGTEVGSVDDHVVDVLLGYEERGDEGGDGNHDAEPPRFFFQAEDGIRDRNVTGVKTCALPIWTSRRRGTSSRPPFSRNSAGILPEPAAPRLHFLLDAGSPASASSAAMASVRWTCRREAARSEERRVGKEGGGEVGAGRRRRRRQ